MEYTKQRYVSYTEAMKILNISSPATFRKYLKLGLPHIEVGKSKRIDIHDIDTFMKNHTYVQGEKVVLEDGTNES